MSYDVKRFCPGADGGGGGGGAEVGNLTTRTDDDTGVVTLTNASHGIATAAAVNVAWSGGSRASMVVGTVAGVTLPIDAGVGDVLPAQDTEVTVTVLPEIGTLTPSGWWDFGNAASLTTYLDSITRISEAEDLSGNNQNLVLPSGKDGPQWNVSTPNLLNGRQTGVFSNGFLTVDFGGVIPQPFTFVQCFRAGSDTPLAMNWVDGIDGTNRIGFYKGSSGNGDSFSMLAPTQAHSGLPAISVSEEFIAIACWNGAASEIIVNGGSPVVLNPGTNGTAGLTIGQRWDFAGTAGFQRMGECAFWDRELTDVEIASVFSILNGKWAIY